jgi:hypothetical protein
VLGAYKQELNASLVADGIEPWASASEVMLRRHGRKQ